MVGFFVSVFLFLCVCCLSWVYVSLVLCLCTDALSLWWVAYVDVLCMFPSLLCLRLLCSVLYLCFCLCVVVLLLVGVSGFIGVCVSLMSLVFLSRLSFFVLWVFL